MSLVTYQYNLFEANGTYKCFEPPRVIADSGFMLKVEQQALFIDIHCF